MVALLTVFGRGPLYHDIFIKAPVLQFRLPTAQQARDGQCGDDPRSIGAGIHGNHMQWSRRLRHVEGSVIERFIESRRQASYAKLPRSA